MSDGGEMLLTASLEELPVHAWDLENGSLMQSYRSAASPRNGTCLAGKELLVSARPDKKMVQMWTWSKDTVHSKSFTTEPIHVIESSHRGYCLVGGGKSGCVHAWQIPTGRLVRMWNAHFKAVSALAFSKDDALLITGGEDGLVHVWNLMEVLDVCNIADAAGNVPSNAKPLHSWSQHTLPITSIAVGIEGDLSLVATSSLDQTVNLWSLVDGLHMRTISFPTAIHCVVLDPLDQAIFAAGADSVIYEHSLVPRHSNETSTSSVESSVGAGLLKGHSGSVNCLCFSEDGSLLISGANDGNALVWDVFSKQCIRQMQHSKPVTYIKVLGKPKSILLRGQRPAKKGSKEGGLPWITLQKYALWKQEEFPSVDADLDSAHDLFQPVLSGGKKSNKRPKKATKDEGGPEADERTLAIENESLKKAVARAREDAHSWKTQFQELQLRVASQLPEKL